MKVFSLQNRVFYLDYQFTYKDLITQILRPGQQPGAAKLLGLTSRLESHKTDQGELHIFTPPPVLPVNFLPAGRLYDFIQQWNARRVCRSARKHLKKLGMEEDLILINSFNPDFGQYSVGLFKEKVHLYHCYDQIEAAEWAQKHGPKAEEKYLAMADAAVFTSDGLAEQKGKKAKRAFTVKNGVNYELFHSGFRPASQSKVVAYIGAIDFRSDYDLLEYTIATLSAYEFHFVGPVKEEKYKKRLLQFENVKFLGSKDVSKLPAFLAESCAGIIPFEKNEFTKGVYPLKVNEYLAAGLPVVSTNFGSLNDFQQILSIATSAQEFASMLKREIESDTAKKRQARAEFAQNNSWQARVGELSSVIEKVESEI